jgi:hypothetical protein
MGGRSRREPTVKKQNAKGKSEPEEDLNDVPRACSTTHSFDAPHAASIHHGNPRFSSRALNFFTVPTRPGFTKRFIMVSARQTSHWRP